MINFRGPLIEDLIKRGHTVYAVAPQIDEETAATLRRLGAKPVEIRLVRTGTNPIKDLSSLWHMYRIFRRLKPDLTLAYAAKPAIYGTLAAWLAGVPARYFMIEGLGYVFLSRQGEGVFKRLLRGLVVRLFGLASSKANKVFFLNPDDAREFLSLGLVRPSQALNIGGIGVDLEIWNPAPPVQDPITFIFVGRLLKDKGVLDYVAAARKIKSAHPAVRFLLVGGVDENPESVSRADVEGWVNEGLVEWPGHVPVASWLQDSSVLVMPSFYREGVPRSTQEAMAMARPVITTDSVGCRETVVDGKNGYLVPPHDPAAIASAMERFIVEPGLISILGTESRRMAEERFDVRKVNASLIRSMGL